MSHTAGDTNKDWIQVDLGAVQSIDRIKIWNRTDDCRNRLGGVYILVSETLFPDNFNPATGNAAFRYKLFTEETGDPEIPVNTRGRYIRLQKSGNNLGGNFLNIAEIQVWQDPDTDSDGVPNYLDTDSDNDFIPDNIEAQSTSGFRASIGIDTDGDGLDNAYDPDNGGTSLLNPIDTDNDDIPDYLDTDSDNDGIPDKEERFKTVIKTPEDLPKLYTESSDRNYRSNANGYRKIPVTLTSEVGTGNLGIVIINSYSGTVTAKITSTDFSTIHATKTFTKNAYVGGGKFNRTEWPDVDAMLVLTWGSTTKKMRLPCSSYASCN